MEYGYFTMASDEFVPGVVCFSCNLLHETDDNLFKNWYIREYGLDMFMELRMRHNKIMKIKAFQIEQLHRLLQSGDVESYKTLLLSLCQ
jgi:hypothetical protein